MRSTNTVAAVAIGTQATMSGVPCNNHLVFASLDNITYHNTAFKVVLSYVIRFQHVLMGSTTASLVMSPSRRRIMLSSFSFLVESTYTGSCRHSKPAIRAPEQHIPSVYDDFASSYLTDGWYGIGACA